MHAKQILHNTRSYSDHYANLIRTLLDSQQISAAGPARMAQQTIEPFIIELEYTQSPWPVIIDKTMLDEFRFISANFVPLFYRAVTGHFGNNADLFHEYVGWPRDIYRFMLSSPLDPEDFIVRYDGLYSNGMFKIVELNVGSTCGGWYTDFLEDVYRDCLAYAKFQPGQVCFRPLLKERFLHILRRVAALKKPRLTGNLLYFMDPMHNQENLISCFQRLYDTIRPAELAPGRLFWTNDPSAVEYRNGGEIFYQGHSIDGVFVKKPIPELPDDLLGRLSIAQARKKILFPDTPGHVMFGSKILLALLYEWIASGKASAADAELVRRYFPWTVRLLDHDVIWKDKRVPLRQVLRQQKDQFVLKLSNSAQGSAVFVGLYYTEQQWHSLVEEKIAQQHWLVQEYCTPDKLVMCDHHSRLSIGDHVWGIAANGSNYGGSFVRGITGNAADGVVNSARGAFLSIVVESTE
ncbi:hypothetical protein [Tahibacter sp.]|uniref:hypothetical protein n=1 Tax=Tahibacter sp. TaxID=2056211 RepID=UPI0028C43A3E|nr:hypothetical protein [Tahibacter sp.]